MQLLTKEFLAQYPDAPENETELGSFVFYRTYSRWLDSEKRRETWKEAAARAVEYNCSIAVKEFAKKNFLPPYDKVRKEAETLFDNVFNLRQFLSGRTHWVGGADTSVADKFPLANFNCSFTTIETWDDLAELFYLLLVGTGVGFRCTKEMAANLKPLRTDLQVIHAPYEPMQPSERIERTATTVLENGFAKMYVGDSKEGWVEAFKDFMHMLTEPEYYHIHTLKISYNSVRPQGERLKTFGGTASGHEPLRDMFQGVLDVIHNKLDPFLEPMEKKGDALVQPRPIHILDIGNLIGNNVVVGGKLLCLQIKNIPLYR